MSVVMAMGIHPLQNYPEAFENGFRVKYRSHQLQAIPDPEMVSDYSTVKQEAAMLPAVCTEPILCTEPAVCTDPAVCVQSL